MPRPSTVRGDGGQARHALRAAGGDDVATPRRPRRRWRRRKRAAARAPDAPDRDALADGQRGGAALELGDELARPGAKPSPRQAAHPADGVQAEASPSAASATTRRRGRARARRGRRRAAASAAEVASPARPAPTTTVSVRVVMAGTVAGCAVTGRLRSHDRGALPRRRQQRDGLAPRRLVARPRAARCSGSSTSSTTSRRRTGDAIDVVFDGRDRDLQAIHVDRRVRRPRRRRDRRPRRARHHRRHLRPRARAAACARSGADVDGREGPARALALEVDRDARAQRRVGVLDALGRVSPLSSGRERRLRRLPRPRPR